MNRSLLIIFLFVLSLLAKAQTVNNTFTVKTNQSGHKNISPYIYGCNDNMNARTINATVRRLGGNRTTGYNWENNASNCGKDCGNSPGWYNDGYMVQSLPSGQRNIPGMAQTAFHDTSLAINPNMYTLLTLQLAGYVAKDKNGTGVSVSETAPSPRFDKVVYKKPAAAGAFTLTPDLTDDSVYMDEFANFIKNKYGPANGATGVRGYSFDNEPALWSSTHARIHPSQAGCKEVLLNTIALAKAVKAVDPTVETFGPVFYSYSDIGNLQCNDWGLFSGSYSNYIEAYIDQMSLYSPSPSQQLLNVIDFHWYPEARDAPSPNGQRIAFGGGNARSVAIARMQAPRSLWDPTYSEISWIPGPINLLNKTIFAAVNKYPTNQAIPRTKVSFTEYEYGGYYHISGGIAQADVLGVFGKYGVYMGNFWPTSTTSPGGSGTSYGAGAGSHLVSAFNLYRDYDGKKSTFGSVGVTSSTSNVANSSIYSSINSATDSTQLHIIVLNKDYDNPMNCTFNLTTKQAYKSIKVYKFDSTSAAIVYKDSIRLAPNTHSFTYTLPKLTAAHFVLDTADVNSSLIAGIAPSIYSPKFLNVYPNPFDNSATIEFSIAANAHVTLELSDLLGKKIRTITDQRMMEGNHTVIVEKNNLPAGIYFCKLSVNGETAVTKLVVN
jgi:hypothetical protein